MSILKKLDYFGNITRDRQEARNMWYSGFRSVFNSVHYLLPGNLLTNFYHSVKITPDMQAPYGIPGTFILAPLSTIIVSPFVDRIQNRIKAYILLTAIATANIFLPYILFCIGPESFRMPVFILVVEMLFGWVGTIMNTLRNGVDAAVACRTMHNSVRGRFISANGIAQGVVGFGIAGFITWAAKAYDVRTALLVGSLGSMSMVVLATLCTMPLRELPDLAESQPATPVKRESPFKDLAKICRMREFLIMMPANLLRGLGNGVCAFIFWLALDRLELPPEYAGYMSFVTAGSPFLGNIILGLTMDRFGAAIMIPVSCTLMAVGMMGTILTNDPAMFLGYFAIYSIMSPVEAAAIPLAHYEVVPNEVMGSFSSVRLGLLQITGSVSTTIAGLLLGCLAPVTVFIGCAALKFIAGILYCVGILTLKKSKKAVPAS